MQQLQVTLTVLPGVRAATSRRYIKDLIDVNHDSVNGPNFFILKEDLQPTS